MHCISFAVLIWSLQVHDNVLCVLWCLCVGHTSTWCSMVTASFVCWLNAGMIIEVLHNEVIISCGFSSCHIATYIKMHGNIIVASNNTDFCHHFSETI